MINSKQKSAYQHPYSSWRGADGSKGSIDEISENEWPEVGTTLHLIPIIPRIN